MTRRIVNSFSTSKTVINDKKKKKVPRKTPSRRSLTPRRPSSHLSSPDYISPLLRTPQSFGSPPYHPFDTPRRAILPSTVSPNPILGFSPLRSSSSGRTFSEEPKKKRSRPGRGPAKRKANRKKKGKKKPMDKNTKYVLGTLARYNREYPPTRPRSSTPRRSPGVISRKKHLGQLSNRLHYVEPRSVLL